MTREGVLEGRNGEANLEGGQNGHQRQGLLTGPYGTFYVGARLPGSEACLKPITGAVEHPGGR